MYCTALTCSSGLFALPRATFSSVARASGARALRQHEERSLLQAHRPDVVDHLHQQRHRALGGGLLQALDGEQLELVVAGLHRHRLARALPHLQLQRPRVRHPAARREGLEQLAHGGQRVGVAVHLVERVGAPVHRRVGARRVGLRQLRELLHGLRPLRPLDRLPRALVLRLPCDRERCRPSCCPAPGRRDAAPAPAPARPARRPTALRAAPADRTTRRQPASGAAPRRLGGARRLAGLRPGPLAGPRQQRRRRANDRGVERSQASAWSWSVSAAPLRAPGQYVGVAAACRRRSSAPTTRSLNTRSCWSMRSRQLSISRRRRTRATRWPRRAARARDPRAARSWRSRRARRPSGDRHGRQPPDPPRAPGRSPARPSCPRRGSTSSVRTRCERSKCSSTSASSTRSRAAWNVPARPAHGAFRAGRPARRRTRARWPPRLRRPRPAAATPRSRSAATRARAPSTPAAPACRSASLGQAGAARCAPTCRARSSPAGPAPASRPPGAASSRTSRSALWQSAHQARCARTRCAVGGVELAVVVQHEVLVGEVSRALVVGHVMPLQTKRAPRASCAPPGKCNASSRSCAGRARFQSRRSTALRRAAA